MNKRQRLLLERKAQENCRKATELFDDSGSEDDVVTDPTYVPEVNKKQKKMKQKKSMPKKEKKSVMELLVNPSDFVPNTTFDTIEYFVLVKIATIFFTFLLYFYCFYYNFM